MDLVPKDYRQNEEERIKGLSNDSLLEETLNSAGGDDYDGCFTSCGEVTYQILADELAHRLFSCGFLSKPPESRLVVYDIWQRLDGKKLMTSSNEAHGWMTLEHVKKIKSFQAATAAEAQTILQEEINGIST